MQLKIYIIILLDIFYSLYVGAVGKKLFVLEIARGWPVGKSGLIMTLRNRACQNVRKIRRFP